MLITAVSARSLVSRTSRSLLSSMNGFPISSITLHADPLYLVEKCYLRAFCLFMMSKVRSIFWFPIDAWNSSISGPDTIHSTVAGLVGSV